MALTPTMFHFDIDLSDSDREVYETIKVTLARQPSETTEYMVTRLLAYCLEYEDGISFSKGLASADEPAVWIKSFDDRIKLWVDIGAPAAERLHKAAKLAERVVVYTHHNPKQLLEQLATKRIHRVEEIPIYSFENGFIGKFAEAIERRNTVSVSRTEQSIYVTVGKTSLNSVVSDQRVK